MTEVKPLPKEKVLSATGKAPKTFYLRERLFSWGGDFDIKDDADEIAFKVKGKVFTTRREQMTITDPLGKKLCVLQPKLLTCGPLVSDSYTYQIYKYQPNFKGQESTATEDGAELYCFAKFEVDPWTVAPWTVDRGSFGLYVGPDNETLEPMLSIEKAIACKMMLLIQNADKQPVAKIGQTQGQNTYGVTVAAGADPLAAICIGIAYDQLEVEKRTANF